MHIAMKYNVEVGIETVIMDGSKAGIVEERFLGNGRIVMPRGGSIVSRSCCDDHRDALSASDSGGACKTLSTTFEHACCCFSLLFKKNV